MVALELVIFDVNRLSLVDHIVLLCKYYIYLAYLNGDFVNLETFKNIAYETERTEQDIVQQNSNLSMHMHMDKWQILL